MTTVRGSKAALASGLIARAATGRERVRARFCTGMVGGIIRSMPNFRLNTSYLGQLENQRYQRLYQQFWRVRGQWMRWSWGSPDEACLRRTLKPQTHTTRAKVSSERRSI
jgi:hypothetical protein